MPKIIAHLKEDLIASARKLIAENGFDALSMKGLAEENDVAVGTIYNYFPDKNAILVTLIVEDWGIVERDCRAEIESSSTLEEGIRKLFDEFNEFSSSHQDLFSHFTTNGNAAYYASYRSFVEEGAELLKVLTKRFGVFDETKDYKMIASLFSYAIHYPSAPYEQIEVAVKTLL